jgi:uncharacterized protein YqjF (DUF2071 family)
VWLFALDATSFVASALARLSLHLPTHLCRAVRNQTGDQRHFETRRASGDASLSVTWRERGLLHEPQPGTLEYFLVQRPYAYSPAAGDRLWREPVRYEPWQVESAEVLSLEHSLDTTHGLPRFPARALAHWSPGVQVELLAPDLV